MDISDTRGGSTLLQRPPPATAPGGEARGAAGCPERFARGPCLSVREGVVSKARRVAQDSGSAPSRRNAAHGPLSNASGTACRTPLAPPGVAPAPHS